MNLRTMSQTPNRRSAYVLGRSDEETTRLQAQARLIDLPTERLFRDAGIGSGKKVLNLGAGAGDVSILAAKLVGPNGSVLGLDVDPGILETARIDPQRWLS